jgi:hypothetical protein
MLELGWLGFAQPWLLAGLLTLPVLWWLLRLTPPPPRRMRFPAIALLLGLVAKEESAARMPWWLLALRMLIAALVILALAEPVLAPQNLLQGKGPVIAVVDNGWAAAADWNKRQAALATLLNEAERSERAVAIVTSAKKAEPPEEISFRPPSQWRADVGALVPRPWQDDREAVLRALGSLAGPAETFWMTDGVGSETDAALAARLQRLGRLTVLTPDSGPLVLDEPEPSATGLKLKLRRAVANLPQTVTVQAVAADDRVLAAEQIPFEAGQAHREGEWTLPRDLANQIRNLRVLERAGAASTVLLDDRWDRHTVLLLADGSDQAGHPLLDPNHYIGSALTDVADVSRATLPEALDKKPSLIVGRHRLIPTAEETAALDRWLDNGGVMVRFAGPELASAPDAWLPVRLRPASRVLGGALTWEKPQGLADFPENSPFHGLSVPKDVTIQRQVLAQPAPDLREKTWASLEDGTPLVTAEARGEGWIVLIHVTATADWSNLPISGLFVEMLARLVRIGQGSVADLPSQTELPPTDVLDGFGVLTKAGPTVRPLPANAMHDALGPAHPPGYYGSEETGVRAWNLGPAIETLAPPPPWPDGVAERPYIEERSRDLASWLWLAAFILLLLDFVASLLLRGLLPRRGLALGVMAFFLLVVGSHPATADDDPALQNTLNTHFAYVVTGDVRVDDVSQAGLAGLSWVLADRTSVEPGEPVGVDLDQSELAFYPLIYWPITVEQSLPSDRARERVAAYLERGGTILFDTRDQYRAGGDSAAVSTTPERQRLRQVLEGVRVPPLMPVPQDHVLTKAFYLLQEFPGRFAGGEVWIEANADTARDGVSSVIIGSNDWGAAWALDRNGRPMYPVTPDGERQREFAYRFGINLIMHVLTGNYKGDQVHVPSILERLGQ